MQDTIRLSNAWEPWSMPVSMPLRLRPQSTRSVNSSTECSTSGPEYARITPGTLCARNRFMYQQDIYHSVR